MKRPTRSAVVLLTGLAFGRIAAQHDSLSCQSALSRILRSKADMQVLAEYDPDAFLKRFPDYRRAFTDFLDSLDRYGLWSDVPDPLELRIEKTRIEFAADPTADKRTARPSLERTIDLLKSDPAAARHGLDYAELCNYLATLCYQAGEIEKEIRVCGDAVEVLGRIRKEGDTPTLLEWMIRTKWANALLASSPAGAAAVIEPIQSLDVRAYDGYAVNSWRKERLENTVASAWEALGNGRAALGDVAGAVSAYEKAMEFTRPERLTWDSIVLGIVKLQAEAGNVREVERWVRTVERRKPQNLLSLYLVAGSAYDGKRNLEPASAAYRRAFELLRKASAEEQIRVLSSLVRVYADLGLQDRIFETLNQAMKERDFLRNDELSYTFAGACVSIGTQVAANGGRPDAYYKAAEKVLDRKASEDLDFFKNPYAGRFGVLSVRLCLERRDGGDLDKADERIGAILDGYRKAARRLGLKGDYASDDVVFAKLARGRIAELRGDAAAAAADYRELLADYAAAAVRGNLEKFSSQAGADSGAAALFRISERALRAKAFSEALDCCEWMALRENLPRAVRERAEFETGRAAYHWGFSDNARFGRALAAFNRIAADSRFRTEADFMTALCQWHLGFRDAAVDNLGADFAKLRGGTADAAMIAFLANENVLGVSRVVAESVFMLGDAARAETLMRTVLDAVGRLAVDTPEEAQGLYDLARFTLRNGRTDGPQWRKADAYLDAFFSNRHALDDRWTYFRAGELKMDIDFELGRLTSDSIRRQIAQLREFNDSGDELRRIVASREFYGGPGMVSLESLDVDGLKEKVQELLAKCHYMLGRVAGRGRRWDEAVLAYDTVLDRYPRFELYASRSLYQKGLIYLTAMNRVDKAVDLFILLFRRYDGSQLADQAMDDLRDAERVAARPSEVAVWLKACRRMYRVSGERDLSRFAARLALVLAERHVGRDDRYTRDRAVLAAVAGGLGWLTTEKDTARIGVDDVARANLLLARAWRLESDLRPASIRQRYGVTFPEGNVKKENACYSRVMALDASAASFDEAQWRMAVNLALTGRPDEGKRVMWTQRRSDRGRLNLRDAYEKEIGVLVAYAAPGETRAYNRDISVSVENILDETRGNGLLPYLRDVFDGTRRQVEVLKRRTGRSDIMPEVLDLSRYPGGKWSGSVL
jgi:tetratricopeptide (TPR) repeat protein